MEDNGQYILEVKDLTKTYPNSQFHLDKVSFAVPYGVIMGFVGENGAGKTTTIGCILNALKKDNGIIRIFGKEMSDDSTEMREQIGVVYDAGNFFGSLTPKNLSGIMGGIYKQWDSTVFKKHLDTFKLPENQKIGTFSKGMTMKLALSVALSHSPKLLVLDEVTSGLDPIVREDVLNIFLDFIKDKTRSVFISSHITSDLEKVADYITFIHNGKILLTESKNNLMFQYGVLRCKHLQFEQVDKKDILAFIKRDYQVDALVADKETMQQKYKNMVVDNVSIDEILLFLVKGGSKYERTAS